MSTMHMSRDARSASAATADTTALPARTAHATRYPIYVAHRLRYAGPLPAPEELGFVPFAGAPFPQTLTLAELSVNPRFQQYVARQRAEERGLLARLADGAIWVARRGMEILCPNCARRYRDYPSVRFVAEMEVAQAEWEGRGYGLGPDERAHVEAFHWLARWRHGGCGVAVTYVVTEGQVLAWTDAYGPWHTAFPELPQ